MSTEPTAADRTRTLADLLKERGVLPEPELLKTFLQVVSDLESAHSQALLHRDISPNRIALDGGNWKLTDYGVVKVGAVRYMSPERCQGRPLDARSDIYSLGVALFEAAAGRVPFDADMRFQIMESHVSSPPPSPRAINPAVSSELERVILRALAKNPADRFQTAGEFKRALEGVVRAAGEPRPKTRPAARPTAKPARVAAGRAPSVPRRVRLMPILIPVLAVVLAVAAYFLLRAGLGGPKVPSVTGMGQEEAEWALRSRGFEVAAESTDDTLAAGTVVAQVPAAGQKAPRSRALLLKVSSGMVAVPSLAGLTPAEARARLAEVALTTAKVDSQYSDNYADGAVVSSSVKAGAKLVPHSSVSLVVSAGRATCPQCGARREAGARFCTKCGYKF